MATCKSYKLDSNATGLQYTEEECPSQLYSNPVWFNLYPNSYSDFGGQISTIVSNPISQSRQRRKGVTSDLEASGGFNQDLAFGSSRRLLQGFFFADTREKRTTWPMNGNRYSASRIDTNGIEFSGTLSIGFLQNELVSITGSKNPDNNKVVALGANPNVVNRVSIQGLQATTDDTGVVIRSVGYQFPQGSVELQKVGDLVQLFRSSGSQDFSQMGLIPGEWIYIGGDEPNSSFTNHKGFARIKTIYTNALLFDKVDFDVSAESGAGKTIRIYWGDVLRNEEDPSKLKRRTYQLERYLGRDKDGEMTEYLIGALPNELTINVAQADKISMDLSFVAADIEQRDGKQGRKTGTRVVDPAESIYNTSSDFNRIKLALVSDSHAAPEPLFAYATEMSLSINNNVSQVKAIGVMGSIDSTAGTFEVGGSMTAYFADVRATRAIRQNASVTLDMIMAKENKGMLIDIPLLTLGDGRINIEQDQAITLPLEINGAQSDFGNTITFQHFHYLPDIAMADQ